jgi:hypothetical protein
VDLTIVVETALGETTTTMVDGVIQTTFTKGIYFPKRLGAPLVLPILEAAMQALTKLWEEATVFGPPVGPTT